MMFAYLTRRMLCQDHFFPPVIIQTNKELIVYHVVSSRPHHLFDYLACPFAYPIYFVISVNFG
jgi:hypothetical protein